MRVSLDDRGLTIVPGTIEERILLESWHRRLIESGTLASSYADKCYVVEVLDGEHRARMKQAEQALTLYVPAW